jgi:two-component system OmpR family response regulator
VDVATDGEEGLSKAESQPYDLILLDLMLPRRSGLDVLENVRKTKAMPVLILTARDSVAERVRGLDLGADDYLVKPFALTELLARARALIRRAHGKTRTVLQIGDVVIDLGAKVVFLEQQPVHLTPREYAIVEYLALHRGQLVSRSRLYEQVFGEEEDPFSSSSMDVHLSNVRKKLGKDFITTRRGEGYLLDA